MKRVRAFLLVPAAVAVVLAAPITADADHCPDSPGQPGGENWCHQEPPPPAADPAPTPTPKPSATPAPSQAPASQAPAPRPFVQPTAQPFSGITPAPSSSIEITVPEGAVFEDETLEDVVLPEADRAANVSTWIFGFFVGLIVGALIGRASWGVSRRRRKQQIFG